MEKITIDDREFIITDEMEEMCKKMRKLFEKVRHKDITGMTLKRSELEELGTWIHNHMHDYDGASEWIFVMLRMFFNNYERDVVWGVFDKYVGIDFSDLITYLLYVLNEKLSKDIWTCQEIVDTFIKDESSSSDSLNFKYCTQQHLSENVKWLMEDIINGVVEAPDHIKQQCAELLNFTDNYGIGARYIGYLIGKSTNFSHILNTVYWKYR